MEKKPMLSGETLVSLGVTRFDASLPEVGLKHVIPNGSWLEQKQVQSALEARKQLVETQRIQKSGTLTIAEWREELKLAEVTRKVGSHWQFFGHNVGSQLYLLPEEALFLMEVNCLLLKYNNVTVSLQQAYSLLLNDKIKLFNYKVYAYFSRTGYKVFRHDETIVQIKENVKKEVETPPIDPLKIKNIAEEADSTETQGKTNEGAVNNDLSVDSSIQTETVTHNNDANDVEMQAENDTNIIIKESNKAKDVEEGNDNVSSNDTKVIDNSEDTQAVTDTAVEMVEEKKERQTGFTEMVQNECDKKTEDKIEVNISEIEKDSVSITVANTNSGVTDSALNKQDEVEQMATSSTAKEEYANFDVVMVDASAKKVGVANESIDTTKEKYANFDVVMNDASAKKVGVTNESLDCENYELLEHNVSDASDVYQLNLQKLENRKIKPFDPKHTDKCFEKVPEIYQKQSVTVNVPEETYIPRNVFLNNISYTLNVKSITTKNYSCDSNSLDEDVNGEHVRRIKGANRSTPVNNQPPPMPRNAFFRATFQNYVRPNSNFFLRNFMFQRPYLPSFFMPRLNYFAPRPPPLFRMYPRFNSFQQNAQRGSTNVNNQKRRRDNLKQTHLDAIKNLAVRLRQLVMAGSTQQQQNIESLQRLINTFNDKYSMRLRLSESFELINDAVVVDTITLDDESPTAKKSKMNEKSKYEENLETLKHLAIKLKRLNTNDEANSRHRRAFSSLIKKFNKSYDVEFFMDRKFQIKDKRLINLDSSSDSDCVVEEQPKVANKKLKNPFNVLKRLSKSKVSSTNQEGLKDEKDKNYSAVTVQTFDKNWLPNKDDFGRAEIFPKRMKSKYLIKSKKEQFLYDFLHSQECDFDNWLDIKISFWNSFETAKTMVNMMNQRIEDTESSLKPLIENIDADWPSLLEKLRIIKNNNETDAESSLEIDFDVYNRDVQNFKKSKRPTPHFRVICISQYSSFPSSRDVASLFAKYNDNVPIMFGVVSVDSISFLQIKPADIPIFIPNDDEDLT